jgi:hypothetical protein
MATKVIIDDVNMSAADNGVIIGWCEKTPSGNGTYENPAYNYRKEVFDDDEDKDLEEAFIRFKELWMQMYTHKKEFRPNRPSEAVKVEG